MSSFIRISTRFLLVLFASLLFASFSLHTIQVKHSHPGHGDNHHEQTLGEYMHHAEKKNFFWTLLGFLFFGVCVRFRKTIFPVLDFRTSVSLACLHIWSPIKKLFNFYCILFSTGVLHSKAY